MKFISLCVLAYKRPEMLRDSLFSLTKYTDYPYELIVNVDTSEDLETLAVAEEFLRAGKISKLITSNGKNRGVGRSFQNCLGLAEGDFIFKVDSDIIFRPRWLSKAVQCLENNSDIGSLGLFDYNRQDPNDDRFKPENNVIEHRVECDIVKDFVSSIYGFRRDDYGIQLLEDQVIRDKVPDDGMHQSFGKMGLLDLVDNKAWGVGKSVYLSGTMDNPTKTVTYDEPLIFNP